MPTACPFATYKNLTYNNDFDLFKALMPNSKTILKQLKAQLRNPRDIDILRGLLKRHGKRLQVARLYVKNGFLFYTGTVGQGISYKMWDECYLRTKGTLDRKAFFTWKCFEGSRKSAERFALGNELASSLYARVMISRKTYPLFCFLKKKSILLIKEGKTVEEAEAIMIDYLGSFGLIRRERGTETRTYRTAGSDGSDERREDRNRNSASAKKPFVMQIVRQTVLTIMTGKDTCEVILDDS